jgi:hypothetical protein
MKLYAWFAITVIWLSIVTFFVFIKIWVKKIFSLVKVVAVLFYRLPMIIYYVYKM